MIKLLGAALIVISAGAVGLRMSRSVKAEDRDLRQLKRALEWMLCEIQGSLTPSQQLCEQAASLCRGQLQLLLKDCADGIGAREAADVGRIMEASLICYGQQLPVSCVCHLRELGSILGQFDAQEQAQAMQTLIERIGGSIAQLQQGKADRCRTYEVLGVCAGCALAILLL